MMEPYSLYSKTGAKHRNMIFFTDFDGTITFKDSNNHMTDTYGMGLDARCRFAKEGNISARALLQKMINSWNMPLSKVLTILKREIDIDPYFAPFVVWARSHGIPVIILSNGLSIVIEALLKAHLGDQDFQHITVIANGIELLPPAFSCEIPWGWTISFRDNCIAGHDKGNSVKVQIEAIQRASPQLPKPKIVFAGDGRNDVVGARQADVVFAREGEVLMACCELESIEFVSFTSWQTILTKMTQLYEQL